MAHGQKKLSYIQNLMGSLLRVGMWKMLLSFSDVGLPGMNGRQLAEEASRQVPKLKILFTTGYPRDALVHKQILDYGVELLTKPFTVASLGRKLSQVLPDDS
jgi:CheY-like chemotaxis protein